MDSLMSFRATRRHLLAVLVLAAFGVGTVAAQNLVEGQNYLRLKNPQPVDTGNKIEVLYFFSFGCPHCHEFDPEVQKWKRTLDANAEFKRVPVDFGREQWANLGRAWYTLDSLGADAKLTSEAFVAIHDKKIPLHQDKAFFDWAAAQGLDRKKVEDTYNSFGVNSKLNRARQLAKNYNVQSIPVVFVDGKFQVSSDKVGGHAAMPAAIDQLIAKARGERPKS